MTALAATLFWLTVLVTRPPELPVALAVIRHFPETARQQMMCIFERESSYRPLAIGDAGERGIAQVHPIHRNLIASLGFTWDDMFKVGPNVRVAAELYRRSGFWPWLAQEGVCW